MLVYLTTSPYLTLSGAAHRQEACIRASTGLCTLAAPSFHMGEHNSPEHENRFMSCCPSGQRAQPRDKPASPADSEHGFAAVLIHCALIPDSSLRLAAALEPRESEAAHQQREDELVADARPQELGVAVISQRPVLCNESVLVRV